LRHWVITVKHLAETLGLFNWLWVVDRRGGLLRCLERADVPAPLSVSMFECLRGAHYARKATSPRFAAASAELSLHLNGKKRLAGLDHDAVACEDLGDPPGHLGTHSGK